MGLVLFSEIRSRLDLAWWPIVLLEMVQLAVEADLHHEDQAISLECFSFSIEN